MTPTMVNLYISTSGLSSILLPQRPSQTFLTTTPYRCIHVHFALLYLPYLFQPRTCPYCEHCVSDFPRWQAQRTVALGDDANLVDQRQAYGHQPAHAVKSYVDEEARESSEYQTSGFGTPRQSVETLGSQEGAFAEGMVGEVAMERKHAASLV